MNKAERQQRIKALQNKNLKLQMIREWNSCGITITENNFVDMQNTLRLYKAADKKTEYMDNAGISKIYSLEEKDIKSVLFNYIVKYINPNHKYIFFDKKSTDLGAVILDGSAVLENTEFLYNVSGFMHTSCEFYLFSPDLREGVCLWASEYDYRVYVLRKIRR